MIARTVLVGLVKDIALSPMTLLAPISELRRLRASQAIGPNTPSSRVGESAGNALADLSAGGGQRSVFGEVQAQFAVALGIVGPVLAHLHEQEEVHGLLDDLGQFLARFHRQLPDRQSAAAHHDRLLAVALDEDRLLDADALALLE